MNDQEQAWRKAIADQVRANCTIDWDIVQKGGDALIYAVCDWIEHPPEWSAFTPPAALAVPAGKGEEVSREAIAEALAEADPVGPGWEHVGTTRGDYFTMADAVLALFTPEPSTEDRR